MSAKIYGLIIAAGLSSRMEDFKPLVRYNQKTFIEHIINKLARVCDEILIVKGFRGYALEDSIKAMYSGDALLKKIDFVHNKNYEKGMFSSVQAGLKAILPQMNSHDYVMLHLVDQPHISEYVYEELSSKARSENMKVIVPSYNMKAGHPIVLSQEIVKEIIVAPDTETLRDVLKRFHENTTYVNIQEDSIIQDVNTQEDRKRYLK